ncbi:NifB/NifX family molybdenum-iron cluster-binding protein [Butyrivibrio sp. WCE2006]|uniref:NifB/NifX family molybdenum-iron cluster-binding protein n=1 Tax=Butyrivibrio sp. WCE2006 TaxID=1410611 RepID=UPI0005D208F0|nr:NifB/NifX family molybdenum-iron cluster-binding protein [Butyrivibrio sp. WCE2006]
MAYLIAVASSDDVNVDLTFGAAAGFTIYEVEGTSYRKKEYRQVPNESNSADVGGNGYGCGGGNEAGCGTGGGCGAGGGCGHGGAQPKVELISDCRSLVCKKIGFQAQKQLEKKQIASFDVSCSVEDALTKISTYFDKLDNHKPYRRA